MLKVYSSLPTVPSPNEYISKYKNQSGIDYVKTPEIRLNGCCADAYNTKEMLLNRFGFLNENITILTDDNTDITKESNTANIEVALKELCEKSKKTAKFIVVFYSGHGTQTPDEIGKDFEIDGKDECWVLSDYKNKGFFQDDKLKCLKSENIHIFFNLSEKTLGFGKNADTTLFLIFKKTLNDYKIMCGSEAVLKMQVQSQEGLLCVLKITEPIVGKIYEIQILSN